MPPASTGVADYAAALVRSLEKSGDVRVNATSDVNLYHVGNNQLHATIYDRALEHPDVIVLHDAVLQHFFLGRLTAEQYIEEFVFNYGEWSRGLAEDLWQNRARSGADPRYFSWPMLKRIATSARAVIVHNPAAAAIVEKHSPDAKIFEIPHLFEAPASLPDQIETLRFRDELGLGSKTLLVGAFGHQRETKRLPVVLRALERAQSAGADARLLIAGAFASTDLERSMAESLRDPKILRTGYLSEADFWRYAAATDVCVNLRFPTAAETSGIAIRMMGAGKTVLFSDGDEIARIPRNACLRVETGAAEEEILAGYFVWLAANRHIAEEIGQHAAAHIAVHHSPEKVAELYWNALKTASA
jgi:glycosyltransferase involved in cell wall biosynthesis